MEERRWLCLGTCRHAGYRLHDDGTLIEGGSQALTCQAKEMELHAQVSKSYYQGSQQIA